MLSQLLIAYSYEFDETLVRDLGNDGSERPPSLAMCANILQFVADEGTAMQELVSLCGVAPPTVKTMLDCLRRHGWVTIASDRVVRLTPHGAQVRPAFSRANDAVERRWQVQCGAETVTALRAVLETASAQLGVATPQYPMPAAHRGAFPRGE